VLDFRPVPSDNSPGSHTNRTPTEERVEGQTGKSRVLLVDDHALMRGGLRMLLDGHPDFEVVGEASDGRSAVTVAAAASPDIVLMDIEMPGENGIEVSRHVLEVCPRARIIILSAFPDDRYVTEAVQVGVSGYLLKGNAPAEVLSALTAVRNGLTYMCPEATSALVASFKASLTERHPGGPALSPRELEVLKMVADGLRTKEIAARLGIGAKTVDTHRARLMKKLGCGSTAELVRYAIREGLVTQ
jgi:DNA-binding NarL/FixJ family response regulator